LFALPGEVRDSGCRATSKIGRARLIYSRSGGEVVVGSGFGALSVRSLEVLLGTNGGKRQRGEGRRETEGRGRFVIGQEPPVKVCESRAAVRWGRGLGCRESVASL